MLYDYNVENASSHFCHICIFDMHVCFALYLKLHHLAVPQHGFSETRQNVQVEKACCSFHHLRLIKLPKY